MKFTQWISAASICTPSRASLQTGRYPIRTGCMGNVEQFRVIPTPASPGGLDPRTETSLAAAPSSGIRTHRLLWEMYILESTRTSVLLRPLIHSECSRLRYVCRRALTNAPMCEMDSDTGTSTKYKSGPVLLDTHDTVAEMPCVENFTRTITHHALEFLSERAVAREAALAVGRQ